MNFTTIGNIELVFAAIPAVCSVAVFARVRWWRSRWGRHLMAYMGAVALVLVLGCIRLVYGDNFWFATLRAVAFGCVGFVLWWRLAYIVEAAFEGSPNESPVVDEKQER